MANPSSPTSSVVREANLSSGVSTQRPDSPRPIFTSHESITTAALFGRVIRAPQEDRRLQSFSKQAETEPKPQCKLSLMPPPQKPKQKLSGDSFPFPVFPPFSPAELSEDPLVDPVDQAPSDETVTREKRRPSQRSLFSDDVEAGSDQETPLFSLPKPDDMKESPSKSKKTKFERLPENLTLESDGIPLPTRSDNAGPSSSEKRRKTHGTIPLPVFNDSARYGRQTTSHLVPPPTPFKAKKGTPSPFVRAAIALNNTLTIRRNDQVYHIVAAPGLAGQHSQIYHVQASTELVRGIPNDQIFVKIFHSHVLLRDGNAVENGFLRTLLGQYDRLRQTDLPTIAIHNRVTAYQDGYLIVEKLNPLVRPWTAETPIHTLSPRNKQLLKEIRVFFDFAFNDPSATPLDLQAGNLGLKTNGSVALLDFMEHSEDDTVNYAFKLISRNCLEDFAMGNEEIYRYLCEGLLEVDRELYARLNEEDPLPVRFDPETLQRI